jgi:cobalamin biosynthesis protein CobC
MTSNIEAPLVHGGDLAAARRLFAGAPEPFIDLSTGINPHSYPIPQLTAAVFARLPEPAALTGLAATAARFYGAPSPDHVVAAPGTQILLPMVAALVPKGCAAVLGPTYAEHVRAAALAGHKAMEVAKLDDLAQADLAVVVNPNNPDGRMFGKDELMALAAVRRSGGLLVIDEAYIDAGPGGPGGPAGAGPAGAPNASLAAEVGRGDVLVLRSFGKFFGLAGVRLGFALAAPRLAQRLAAALGPWAVSGPAIAIGWAATMRERLVHDILRLDCVLGGAGLAPAGGTALFRLVRAQAASEVFQQLGRAGILVRRFVEQPSWLRIGFPGDEAEWARLTAALARQ